MRVLTVRQPWAELIVAGRKTVENRSMRTLHRGEVAIHAGLRDDPLGPRIRSELVRGAIIGVVDIVDCVQGYRSRWAEPGAWHWVLRNPVRLRSPIAFRGALGLRTLDAETARRVHRLTRQRSEG